MTEEHRLYIVPHTCIDSYVSEDQSTKKVKVKVQARSFVRNSKEALDKLIEDIKSKPAYFRLGKTVENTTYAISAVPLYSDSQIKIPKKYHEYFAK